MSARPWTAVRVRSSERSAVSAVLFDHGAEAVQETDDALVTHLRHVDRAALREAVHTCDRAASIEFSDTPDVDWSSAWRSRITAHRVGRLVVTPPWLADDYDPGERIVIEPAMAFGTGEHESTRGVLHLMQQVVEPGDVVGDLGAGSAVLAIAAAKLGASRVVAIELDPDAIGNAEENVRANDAQRTVSVIEGNAASLLPLVAPVRVVLANIVSSVLIELLPVIDACTGADARAVLGGMLVDERALMERACQDRGWRLEASESENSWWSATIARR